MAILDAFPDLDVCGASLFIGENQALTSIGGFGELDSVGTLTVSYSPLLTDIGVFDRSIAIGSFLEVVFNGSLSVCNVQAICDYVLDPRTPDTSSKGTLRDAGVGPKCMLHARAPM